jgi:hypothetical protein
VSGGNIEVALRIEANVAQGVTAELDVRFAKRLDLSGARSRQKLDENRHWLRFAR